MENIIHLFILIPLFGFILSVILPRKEENYIAKTAFLTIGSNVLLSLTFIPYWIYQGANDFNLVDLSIYKTAHYDFFIDFFFDRVTATFFFVGNLLSFLVVIYSRYYMHKESGYKRFFNTIQFFYLGYTLVILSGNFETLFIGWEILGISSFLLIAFYRQRYLPIKNALKVFAIYRIGDVGILLAMWLSHHLWHENITFLQLHNEELVHHVILEHSLVGAFISLMILVAALAKSAQLPFSAWLPRAMEGPTPSSAIFYGALSVHIGAFLLMRTFPFWEHQLSIRVLIFIMGLVSAIVTSMIARVQSTIKGKIAYSSAAQIGIIFMEIALGLEVLALIHFVSNAFLRSYQLLISPSIVTYMVREQFYNFVPEERKISRFTWFEKLKTSLYIFSLKEWRLESLLYLIVFSPLKKIRKPLAFINLKSIVFVLIPLYVLGTISIYFGFLKNESVNNYLALAFAFLAFSLVAKAYNERKSARLAWLLIIFAHFFIDLAVSFNDHLDIKEAGIYLSGIIISGIIGFGILQYLHQVKGATMGLNQFHGWVQYYPKLSFIFLVACLGIAGFPISTTFFGEDLVLTHIQEDQFLLATLISISFILIGIAVIRIFARIFLGHYQVNPQEKTDLTL